MAFFENIEIQKLFCAEEADTFPPFTEKDLAETEKLDQRVAVSQHWHSIRGNTVGRA